MSKNNANKFSPELRERAVRLVQVYRGKYPSLWLATESIVPKIGCTAQTLLNWVKRHEIDNGQRLGLTTAKQQRINPDFPFESWQGQGSNGNKLHISLIFKDFMV
jgi:transposase-like protein